MKLSTTFFLLPFAAFATTITSPEIETATLPPHKGPCKVNIAKQHCYFKPFDNGSWMYAITAGETFNVTCLALGKDGQAWDYVEAYNCWIPYSSTSQGCGGE